MRKRKEQSRIPDELVKWFIIVWGLLFIAAGTFMVKESGYLLLEGEKTTGVVVGYEERKCRTKVCYAKKAQFTTDRGRSVSFVSSFAERFDNPGQWVGEQVTIYYNQDDPEDAIIYNFFDIIIFPLIFLGGGTIFPFFILRSFNKGKKK